MCTKRILLDKSDIKPLLRNARKLLIASLRDPGAGDAVADTDDDTATYDCIVTPAGIVSAFIPQSVLALDDPAVATIEEYITSHGGITLQTSIGLFCQPCGLV